MDAHNIMIGTTRAPKVFLGVLGSCGVIPLYRFSKPDELCKKITQVLYTSLILTVAVIVRICHIIEMRNIGDHRNFPELLELAIVQLSWMITVIQSYQHRFVWHKLIQNVLKSMSNSCNYWNLVTLIKQPIVYVLIFDVAIHVLGLLNSSVLHSVSEITHHITFFVRNLICLRIIIIVHSFKEKHSQLTQELQTVVEEPPEKAMKRILLVRKTYMELDDLMQTFNYVNGYQILLLIAASSLQLINITVYIIIYFRTVSSDSEDNMPITLPFPLTYLGTMVNLFYMMDCCNAVAVASEELLRTIYEVNRHFSTFSEHFLELKSLSKLIYFHRTKITAADYFQINRLTVFYFLYNTSAYFVVLVQFYNSKRNT